MYAEELLELFKGTSLQELKVTRDDVDNFKEIVAYANFEYLSKKAKRKKIESKIEFTIRDSYIKQSNLLSGLGIIVTPGSEKYYSTAYTNPFGPSDAVNSEEIRNTTKVSFPTRLFKKNTTKEKGIQYIKDYNRKRYE